MRSYSRHAILGLFLVGLLLMLGQLTAPAQNQPASTVTPLSQLGATFSIPDSELSPSLSVLEYGDMRFTDPTNTRVASPQARQLLAERVAFEHPDVVELTGDIPYAGVKVADYDEFRAETSGWRKAKLRVFPALGNHEMVGNADECLKNWWATFPELTNRRWYSVQIGKRAYLINLDSNSNLLEGSPQMLWVQSQIGHLPSSVDFVFIGMHHPPVADKQTLTEVDHNPRPNEIALRDYLSKIAPRSHPRFIVIAGHIHNYERFQVSGVTYLVSGGGGASPYMVERGPADQYQTTDLINYHYVLFRLEGKQLKATMYRLADPAAQTPEWQARDSFVITAQNTNPR